MSDQAAGLRRQLNGEINEAGAKTIAIVSGKGGVGKSNFALNFSLKLLEQQKRVLLVDLDVGMGNINILLGFQTNKTIVDMLADSLPIHEIIEPGPKGLSFISGGTGLTSFFAMGKSERSHFYSEYNQIVHEYDYIIFDMGAGATKESIFFVLASDECIVITTPEPTSIMDAYSMVKHIVHQQHDMPIYVVMNRSIQVKQSKESLGRFQQVVDRFLGVKISILGMIPEDRNIPTAVMSQTPYVLFNPRSAASKSMKQLTEDYVSLGQKNERLKPLTFIQKLKSFLREG